MPTKHILIIEDDADIAELLRRDLEDAGYRVTWRDSVMSGLLQAREVQPDLLLLDLGLPDGDGRDVLKRLRRSSDLPVIVLTARDVVGEKVELLALGADDYMVKPFHVEELLARIKVQFREDTGEALKLGELELHLQKRLVLYQGQPLALSNKEFDLLSMLMRQPGRVFTRQEVMQEICQDSLPSTSNVIDVHMSKLRSKLRGAELYGLLRTVRGFGYSLRA